MDRRTPSALLGIGILVACCLPAVGDIVAIKRTAGLTDDGGIHQDFKDAINGATIVQYTDAASVSASMSGDVVDDTGLWGGTTSGDARWANIGTHEAPFSSIMLMKFAAEELPGFAGGTVNRAEVRLYYNSGNTGTINMSYITSTAWSEGNKGNTTGYGTYGDYPGKDGTGNVPPGTPPAPGASRAHPNGLNTGTNQDTNGLKVDAYQSWGDGNDFFNPAAVVADFTVAPVDGNSPGDGNVGLERNRLGFSSYGGATDTGSYPYDGFAVWDVTDIVVLWAAGTSNFGLYIPDRGNRTFQFSETSHGANFQPVLFLDYTPVPEPATLALLGLSISGLAALRRRRK